MANAKSIREPVAKEMKEFELFFGKVMQSNIPLLKNITNYIYRRKGKQLRPLIVFLTSGLNGRIGNSTYVAAAMIELLHTATLMHDDVVDEAYERRGAFSINALWRSKIAVLAGDFLLSKGLQIAVENQEYQLLHHISKAVQEMSEGELLQIDYSRKMNVDEDIYFQIIRKKTATLIAACSITGAQAAGASTEQLENMYQFGENLGLAFQIKDDIFDFQPHGLIGKPTGNDIKEGKLTLPLIYALSQVNSKEQSAIRSLVRKGKHDPKAVEKVMQFATDHGGLEYATDKMNHFAQMAHALLEPYPASEFKQSLTQLVDYTINRKL